MIQEKCEPVELPNSYLWNTQINYISEPDNRGFGKGLDLQDLMARPDLVESGVENGHATDGYGERRLLPFPVYYDEWKIKTNDSVFIDSCNMFFVEKFDKDVARDMTVPLNFEMRIELETELLGDDYHMFYKLIKFGKVSVGPKDDKFYRHSKGTPLGFMSYPMMQEGYEMIHPRGNSFNVKIDPKCEFAEVPDKKTIENHLETWEKTGPFLKMSVAMKKRDAYLFNVGTVVRHYLFWVVIVDEFGQPVFEKYVIFSRPGVSGCENLKSDWPNNDKFVNSE